jgi:hypothetical protein
MKFTISSFSLRRLGRDRLLTAPTKAYHPTPSGSHISDEIKGFFLLKTHGHTSETQIPLAQFSISKISLNSFRHEKFVSSWKMSKFHLQV